MYAYNAQLDIIEYQKKAGFFKDREDYIAVSSPDKNFKINNVENFTRKIKKQKDFLELNLRLQGSYNNINLTPILGAELQFNPDGKIKYLAGYNYYYDFASGKFVSYYLAGFQFNLIRF